MKSNSYKGIELLAPAGGMEHFIAAVENGADAVYLGGKLFNARINANNFSIEEIEEAVNYAHIRNVKVYVTMNILLTDEQLEDAVIYAKKLRDIGVDAVIVQDLGLAYAIKREIKGLALHISTQMSIYNREGVRAVKKLGAERVVLARELSLEEIEDCCKEETEIEVFGHGALCICYSGQCNMSRLSGGRSGNRGQCAQSCRLKYASENGVEQYWLSPKDLCTIDLIPQLISAGVTSLKLEGRMKSPEYVGGVVAIYRKYIDDAMQKITDEKSVNLRNCNTKRALAIDDMNDERANAVLAQLFNRGGFTNEYLRGRSGEELMSYDLPKHQGVYIGRVLGRINGQLLEIELAHGKELKNGDGIEIRNQEMPGNVVTYIRDGKTAKSLIIGDIKGKVSKGDEVYKITDKDLMEEIRATFSNPEKPKKRLPINMTVFMHEGKAAKLTIMENLGAEGLLLDKTFSDIIPEKAVNKSLDKSRVMQQMEKCGEYPFYINNFEVEMDSGITVPISSLNRMRREALAEFCQKKLEAMKSINWSRCEREIVSKEFAVQAEKKAFIGRIYLNCINAKGAEKAIAELRHKRDSLIELRESINHKMEVIVAVPIYELDECLTDLVGKLQGLSKDTGIEMNIIPYIYRITRNGLDEGLRVDLDEKLKRAVNRPILVGNLGWLNELRERGYDVIGDYGLNITNTMAERALAEVYGVKESLTALEYNEECYLGRRPLMVMDHKIKSKVLIDRKGKSIDVEYLNDAKKTILVQGDCALREELSDAIEIQRCKKEEAKEIVIFV